MINKFLTSKPRTLSGEKTFFPTSSVGKTG